MRYIVSTRVRNEVSLALKPSIHSPTLTTYYGSHDVVNGKLLGILLFPLESVIVVIYSKIMRANVQNTCLCVFFTMYCMSMQSLSIVHLVYLSDTDNPRKYMLEKQPIILKGSFLYFLSKGSFPL